MKVASIIDEHDMNPPKEGPDPKKRSILVPMSARKSRFFREILLYYSVLRM